MSLDKPHHSGFLTANEIELANGHYSGCPNHIKTNDRFISLAMFDNCLCIGCNCVGECTWIFFLCVVAGVSFSHLTFSFSYASKFTDKKYYVVIVILAVLWGFTVTGTIVTLFCLNTKLG